MLTSTRQFENEAKPKVWFVRNEQGVSFGPVDFDTLKAWARDGRVGPANEVSSDGAVWQRAIAQDGLEMDWVAEVTPGCFYGPIHHQAIQDLINEGTLSRQATLFRRGDIGEVDTLRDELRTAHNACAGLGEELERSRCAVSGLEKQCQQARQLSAQRDEEVLGLRHTLDAQASQARAVLSREQAKIAELERQLIQSGLEQNAAAHRIEKVRLEYQAKSADWESERHLLVGEQQQLLAKVNAVQAENASKEARIVQLEASVAEAQGESVRLREVLEGQILTFQAAMTAAQAERSEQQALVQRTLTEKAALAEAVAAARRASESDRLQQETMQRALSEALQETDRLRDVLSRQAERSEQQALEQRALTEKAALAEAAAARRASESDRLQLETVQRALNEALQEAECLRNALRLHKEQSEPPCVSETVEILEAEPMESHTRSKARPQPRQKTVEADVVSPPANPAGWGRTTGLSLVELEQQARRELERLGAHGPSFFAKKR